ncbi:MAG: twin-arginine translocase TatA/TatE family subunit [Candidatus Dormibacteria bacterium]
MGALSGHLPEIIIVLAVILIIWGPGKLPDLGAAMGRGIREFRKASSDAHEFVLSAPTTTPAEPATPAPVAQVSAPLSAPVDAGASPHQPTVSG